MSLDSYVLEEDKVIDCDSSTTTNQTISISMKIVLYLANLQMVYGIRILRDYHVTFIVKIQSDNNMIHIQNYKCS